MGRRRDENRTRHNRTRGYSGGGYDRPGYGRGEPPGERRDDYPDEGLYGPYFDRRGNRYFEDPRGRRYYDDDFAEPYYADYARERYERDTSHNTGRTAIKWAGVVAVALILVVGLIMATDNFTGGPDSAQQAAQQAPQQASQQPVQPQQPVAPQQPQAPSPQAPSPQAPSPQAPSPQAPSPQAPAAPQPGGPSADQVEGMRADVERQLAEIRQSLNQLRLEIWSLFTSQQNEQQEGSP